MTEHDKITSITERVTTPDYSLPLTLYEDAGDKPICLEETCYEGAVMLTDYNDGESVVLSRHNFRPLALALLALADQEES